MLFGLNMVFPNFPSLMFSFCVFVVVWTLIAALYIFWSLPKSHMQTLEGVPWHFRSKWGFWQRVERLFNIDPTTYIQEGYLKYCKSHSKQPFTLANVLESDPVVIPSHYFDTVLFAKESQLSLKANFSELFQVNYTSDPVALGELYDIVVKLIGKDMTNLLNSDAIAAALSDETRAGLLEEWGDNTDDWVEVPLCLTMENLCSRLVNLLAIGPEMCGDPTFLHATIRTSEVTVYGSIILKCIPKALRVCIGPLIGLASWWYHGMILKCLRPLLEQKMAEKESLVKRKESSFLDFLISIAYKGKKAIRWRPEDFTNPIFMFTFPGVHAAAVQGYSFFVDLLSSHPEEAVWDILLEEVQSISPRGQGVWTAGDLDRAVLLDSAIKESLRLNGLSTLGPIRKVVQTSGITLPNGVHLPCGTSIAVPQFSIHRDPDLYSRPQEYQPWRFAQQMEQKISSSMTDTSGTYLAFGHGRRPCPGRHIFSHIFKLLTAEILLNYEMKPILSRPQPTRFGRFLMPEKWLMVSVRRRKSKINK